MTSIFSMKYESGSSVGGGCVGGLRKKEMIWHSHLIQMKKFNRISELSCLRFLNSESVILAL